MSKGIPILASLWQIIVTRHGWRGRRIVWPTMSECVPSLPMSATEWAVTFLCRSHDRVGVPEFVALRRCAPPSCLRF